MEFIEPEITQVDPADGFDNAATVRWNKPFVDKWQYHKVGLYEWLEIRRGIVTIEFSSVYALKNITLHCEDAGLTPNLLVHRLKSDYKTGATIKSSFKEPWDEEQEPLFETEDEALNSLADYLSSQRDKVTSYARKVA